MDSTELSLRASIILSSLFADFRPDLLLSFSQVRSNCFGKDSYDDGIIKGTWYNPSRYRRTIQLHTQGANDNFLCVCCLNEVTDSLVFLSFSKTPIGLTLYASLFSRSTMSNYETSFRPRLLLLLRSTLLVNLRSSKEELSRTWKNDRFRCLKKY